MNEFTMMNNKTSPMAVNFQKKYIGILSWEVVQRSTDT